MLETDRCDLLQRFLVIIQVKKKLLSKMQYCGKRCFDAYSLQWLAKRFCTVPCNYKIK